VLDLAPEKLPDQTVCDLWYKPNPEESGTWTRREPFYSNELGAYLKKHHGLAYVNLQPHFMSILEVKDPGIHFMSGKTVRTPASRENHVVVARYGELLWDPHPSRAGLVEVIYWAFLVPYPAEWSKYSSRETSCHCPECGGFQVEQSIDNGPVLM
jgi:hypothetical protein